MKVFGQSLQLWQQCTFVWTQCSQQFGNFQFLHELGKYHLIASVQMSRRVIFSVRDDFTHQYYWKRGSIFNQKLIFSKIFKSIVSLVPEADSQKLCECWLASLAEDYNSNKWAMPVPGWFSQTQMHNTNWPSCENNCWIVESFREGNVMSETHLLRLVSLSLIRGAPPTKKKKLSIWEISPKCGWMGWLIPKQGPNP